jgi:hypothetical protein
LCFPAVQSLKNQRSDGGDDVVVAAAGTRQYTAIFAIGGKLLGSFRGAMAQAQARLSALHRSAVSMSRSMGRAFKSLAFTLGGIGTLIGGYAVSKIFSKIFGDATKEIIKQEQVNRKLLASLKQNPVIAKKGGDYAQKQFDLLREQSDELLKIQAYGEDVLQAAQAEAVFRGLTTKQITASLGPMMDVLAVSKGVRATEEDSIQLAADFTNAIKTDRVMALKKYGIVLTKQQQKEFKHLGNMQKKWEYLQKIITGPRFAGEAEKLMKTPEGRIMRFNDELGEVAERVGKEILPAQAELADAWRRLLPHVERVSVAIAKGVLAGTTKAAMLIEKKIMPAWDAFGMAQQRVFQQPPAMQPLISPDYAKPLGQQFWQNFMIGFDVGIEYIQSKFAQLMAWLGTKIGDLKRNWQELTTWLSTVDWTFGLANQWRAAMEQFKSYWASALNDLKSMWNTFTSTLRPSSWWPWGKSAAPATPPMPAAAAPAGGLPPPDIPEPGTVPGYQFGGVVRRPTLASIAERGPEAVVPLGRKGGFGETHVTFSAPITINGNVSDDALRDMQSKLSDAVRDFIANFKRAQYQERRLSFESGYG